MWSSKRSVNSLVKIIQAKGINNIVFSPGSRNAPLVIAFENKGFNIITIADERVAAFYALGQGLATGLPSIICCTSGSALLNYAPAISEAYYQGIPMIVISADRPEEWIDMGIGQSIRQKGIFDNYCKKSFQLRQNTNSDQDLWYNDRLINEAISSSLQSKKGPVHINISFKEPLYETLEHDPHTPKLIELHQSSLLTNESNEVLLALCNSAKKKIILCGQQNSCTKLLDCLNYLSKENFVILTEATSNLPIENAIYSIDRCLQAMKSKDEYAPDLVITLGGAIVSKYIKTFLQNVDIIHHIHLGEQEFLDTFKSLTTVIAADPQVVLNSLKSEDLKNEQPFQDKWANLQSHVELTHNKYLKEVIFSDLQVFSYIIASLNSDHNLHLANSTPIRYAQLFKPSDKITYHSNRGVSGIDGCTSTFLGYSSETSVDKTNILVTGDIAFLYDSNAFWIPNLSKFKDLTIFLINNGGGGIFRYIEGPDTTNSLESVFESAHNLNAQHLADMYQLNYFSINNIEELIDYLSHNNYSHSGINLVEIHTPRHINAGILKNYFKVMDEPT